MSRYPWHSEFPVGVDDVSRALRADVPPLADADLAALGEGWDFATFVATTQAARWVVRVPKRRSCARALTKEMDLLDAVHHEIGAGPVDIPRYEWRIDVPASLALPYAIYRYLDGRQLYHVAAEADVVTRTAHAVGAFLRQLHALDVMPRRRFVDQFDGHLHEFRKYLAALGDALPGGIHAAFARLLESPYPRFTGTPRVCHADLLTEHVLVAENRVAVIDWGDARLDDPWSDFVGLWTWAGDRAVHVAAEAYGQAPASSDWHRIRFKGACVTLGQCYYGRFGGNDALFRSSLVDLARMLDNGQIEHPALAPRTSA